MIIYALGPSTLKAVIPQQHWQHMLAVSFERVRRTNMLQCRVDTFSNILNLHSQSRRHVGQYFRTDCFQEILLMCISAYMPKGSILQLIFTRQPWAESPAAAFFGSGLQGLMFLNKAI